MHYIRFRDPTGNVRKGCWTKQGVEFGNKTYELNEIDVLPPADPSKILCVGANYPKHIEEADLTTPEKPRFFIKPPNTAVGHEAEIVLPEGKERIEPELELGIVIERQCRNVSAENVRSVIEGFTCFNDLSNRDDQFDVEKTGRPDMIRGKAFDNAAPVGPVVATPNEVPESATMELRVNGDIWQQTTRDEQLFTEGQIIESISSYITLEPGDIISTGTPRGPAPLSDRDKIEVEIEGIGTLRNTVRTCE